jgi:uncharacterized protein (TIGR02594 family)
MAKDNYIIGFVFGLIIWLGATSICNAKSNPLRERLKQVYDSQVGVQELTGKNDGKEVERYLKVCGLKKGNPWCAAFLAWCFKSSGIKTINSAYAPSWFPKNRIIPLSKAQPGDVVGFYFRDKKRIAHVGFYDCVSGAFVITVEGNTSATASMGNAASREGDGVFKKRRLKRQIYRVSKWIE